MALISDRFCFTMDVLWVLLIFSCFSLSCGEDNTAEALGTEPNTEKTVEIELFPPKPTYAGQTRKPRTLFKKLHSGAAFLAGLKLGAILSKKGFELGHGKIASAHSFQIFGKSVNSAMSLSYGDANSLLPLVDDDPGPESPKRMALEKEDKKVFRVTVIEDSSNDTMEEPLVRRAEEEKLTNSTFNGGGDKKDDLLMLDQNAEEKTESNFLTEHNRRVKEFNESIFKKKKVKY